MECLVMLVLLKDTLEEQNDVEEELHNTTLVTVTGTFKTYIITIIIW